MPTSLHPRFKEKGDQILRVLDEMRGFRVSIAIDKLIALEEVYIDPTDTEVTKNQILNDLLSPHHMFLIGRSGTGKSTFFMRGYYECLKTIVDQKKHQPIDEVLESYRSERILPLYINLFSSDIWPSEEKTSRDSGSWLVLDFLERIIKQINLCLDGEYLPTNLRKRGKKIVQNTTEEIQKILNKMEKNREDLRKEYEKKIETTEIGSKKVKKIGVTLKILPIISPEAKKEQEEVHRQEIQIIEKYRQEYRNNFERLFAELTDSLEPLGLNRIVLFIDEYSEIPPEAQKIFMNDIMPVFIPTIETDQLSTRVAVKIAAYPRRIFWGSYRRDKEFSHTRDLEIDEFYKAYTQGLKHDSQKIEAIIKKHELFVKRLIEKRLKNFNPTFTLNDLLEIDERHPEKDYLELLVFASTGVPRNLGLILYGTFSSSYTHGKKVDMTNLKNFIKGDEFEKFISSILRQRMFERYQDPERVLQLWGLLKGRAFDVTERIRKRGKKGLEKIEIKATRSAYFMFDPAHRETLAWLESAFLILRLGKLRPTDITTIKSEDKKLDLYVFSMRFVLINDLEYHQRKFQIINQNKFDFSKIIKPDKRFICENHGEIKEEKTFWQTADNIYLCPQCYQELTKIESIQLIDNTKSEKAKKTVKQEIKVTEQFQRLQKLTEIIAAIWKDDRSTDKLTQGLLMTFHDELNNWLTIDQLKIRLQIAVSGHAIAGRVKSINNRIEESLKTSLIESKSKKGKTLRRIKQETINIILNTVKKYKMENES